MEEALHAAHSAIVAGLHNNNTASEAESWFDDDAYGFGPSNWTGIDDMPQDDDIEPTASNRIVSIVWLIWLFYCFKCATPSISNQSPIPRDPQQQQQQQGEDEKKETSKERQERISKSLVTKKVLSKNEKTKALQLGDIDVSSTSDNDDEEQVNDKEEDANDNVSLESNEDTSSCMICLDTFHVGDDVSFAKDPEKACCHVFHEDCINSWLTNKKHDDCPACRIPLLIPRQTTTTTKEAASTSLEQLQLHSLSLPQQDENEDVSLGLNNNNNNKCTETKNEKTRFVVVRGLISRVKRSSARYSFLGEEDGLLLPPLELSLSRESSAPAPQQQQQQHLKKAVNALLQRTTYDRVRGEEDDEEELHGFESFRQNEEEEDLEIGVGSFHLSEEEIPRVDESLDQEWQESVL